MDGVQRALDPVYENFDPQTQWQPEEEFDTLIVRLSGFRKEQIRVYVTAERKLRIMGERPLGNNRWRRFHKEFPIPQNVDPGKIVGKHEGGVLYVKCPKVITPVPESRKLPTEVAKPQQKPRLSEPPQAAQRMADQKQVAQEFPSKANGGDKQTIGKTASTANEYNAADQKTPKSSEEAGETSGKSSAAAPAINVIQKPPGMEKELRSTAEGKSHTEADTKMALLKTPDQKAKEPISEANNLSQKIASDRERSELETKEEPRSTTGDKKHKSPGSSVNEAAQMDKGSASGSDKSRLEGYKEVVGGLARKMRKAKKVTNLVVAALLVLVLGLYIKNASKPAGQYGTRPAP